MKDFPYFFVVGVVVITVITVSIYNNSNNNHQMTSHDEIAKIYYNNTLCPSLPIFECTHNNTCPSSLVMIHYLNKTIEYLKETDYHDNVARFLWCLQCKQTFDECNDAQYSFIALYNIFACFLILYYFTKFFYVSMCVFCARETDYEPSKEEVLNFFDYGIKLVFFVYCLSSGWVLDCGGSISSLVWKNYLSIVISVILEFIIFSIYTIHSIYEERQQQQQEFENSIPEKKKEE